MSYEDLTPADYIRELGLQPHAEGGWYNRTWREDDGTERGSASAIYYLLEEGQKSHWHRNTFAEMWLWHAGHPLIIETCESRDGPVTAQRVDPLHPQGFVAKDLWQTARPVSGWTLVTCVVSPGFDVSGWELAPEDWAPTGWSPAR
ncbi:MAG: cupin domain-containing protein [Rhodobacteraceae bacterium]|nr:cupin domain-containing protein [Paracoccaceae bacterium]MBR9821698.1 cupin domain-containing protein [Paracoccaceae bacterium]